MDLGVFGGFCEGKFCISAHLMECVRAVRHSDPRGKAIATALGTASHRTLWRAHVCHKCMMYHHHCITLFWSLHLNESMLTEVLCGARKFRASGAEAPAS